MTVTESHVIVHCDHKTGLVIVKIGDADAIGLEPAAARQIGVHMILASDALAGLRDPEAFAMSLGRPS